MGFWEPFFGREAKGSRGITERLAPRDHARRNHPRLTVTDHWRAANSERPTTNDQRPTTNDLIIPTMSTIPPERDQQFRRMRDAAREIFNSALTNASIENAFAR